MDGISNLAKIIQLVSAACMVVEIVFLATCYSVCILTEQMSHLLIMLNIYTFGKSFC